MNVVTGERPLQGFFSTCVLAVICICLVVASLFTLPQLASRLVLASIFIATGIILRRNEYFGYLLFLGISPLIPSHLSQIGFSEFPVVEFYFFCFVFWWCIFKIIAGKPLFMASSIRPLLIFQFGFLCISAFLALYSSTFMLSRVFLLQLKDHWDFFLPRDPTDVIGPLRAWLVQSEGILFFFISLDILNSDARIRKAAATIFYSALIVSILGLLQYAFHFRLLEFWLKENPNLIRINSTMDDPNSLGTYLAAALCLGVFVQSLSEGRVLTARLLSSLVLIAAVWATGSRSSLGTLLIVLVIVPLILRRAGFVFASQTSRVTRWIARIHAFVIALLVVSVVIATWLNTSIDRPGNWVEFLLTSLNISQPSSTVLKERTALWGTAIRMSMKNPVLGTGLGGFLYRTSNQPFDYPELRVPHNVHNYYLQILAETGILGLLLFIAILFVILKPAVQRLFANKSNNENLECYGYVSAIFVFLITSITGHPLLLPKLQFLFWAILACIYAQNRGASDQSDTRMRKFLIACGLILLIAFPVYLWAEQRNRNTRSVEAGYYAWERDATGQPIRWTTEEAVSNSPRYGNNISFGIRQIDAPLQKMPTNVDIFLNGRLRERITLNRPQWKNVTYNLDAYSDRKRVLIDIKPEKTFQPAEFGMPDFRRLGVQLTPFRWDCYSDVSKPSVFAFYRSADQTMRFSMIALQGSENPASVQVNDSSGAKIALQTGVWPNAFSTADSVALFAPFSPDSVYRVDGTHSMEIRKQLDGKAILFRIQARAMIGIKTFPILYVHVNGKQLLKIPVSGIDWNSFYFELPGPISEMSFSNWDGLSETSNETDTSIQIRELRAWPHQNAFHHLLGPGWFETAATQETIQWQPALQNSVGLVGTGDSIITQKNWAPGIVSLVITARAQLAGSEPPVLGVYVANRNLGSIPITSEQTQEYKFDVPLAGDEQLKISFENDYSDLAKREDRNVIISAVRLERHPSLIISERLQDPLLPPEPCFTLTQKH